MMDELISIAFVQFSTSMAILCGLGGMDWITQGDGLHPLVAGMCITAFLLAPYFISLMGRLKLAQEDEDETA